MVDPTPSDYNLTYLRDRWERDRSSRIFLQLAEEYRRRGLHTEALEVLETGLGFHPGYLAAQVALGRCRLEAGQAEAAVKVLERVLTQDPTQAVATRLLAESWLQLGDEDRAQAALDRCRLIGIPPSELAGLEQRMAASRRAARERWTEPEPSEATAPPGAPAVPPTARPAAAALPRQQAPIEAPGPTEPSPRERPEIAAPAIAPAPPPLAHPSAPAATPAPPPPAPAGWRVRDQEAPSSPGSAEPVFRMPQQTPRSVVLPLRPAGDRRLVGARTDPFGDVARPRPRAAAAAEIFRLLPAPTAPPAEVAAAEAPPVAAPQPAAQAPPITAGQSAVEAPPTARQPAAEPAAVAPAPAPATAADRWWASPASAAPSAASIPATPDPAPSAPAAPLTSAPTPPSLAAAAAPPGASTAGPGRWWERPRESTEAAAPPAAAPSAPETVPPPAAPPPELAATTAPAAAPAPSPAPPPVVAAAAPQVPPAPRRPLADTAGVELQESGSIAMPELRPSDPGTATLGELYLRQGYVREAEEIFKQVLARDADNEAALAGLEAIGRRRAQKITAAELVAGDEDTEVRGLTARKIQLLTRYLRKLRRGTGTDVPGTAQ